MIACAFCAPTAQAQPVPVLETNARPAGNVSVTMMLPFVGPVPLFVTLTVYTLLAPTTKSPAGCVSEIVTSGAVTVVGALADLSFVPESPVSATVALFVTLGTAADATETVRVIVLLALTAMGPALVQVTV